MVNVNEIINPLLKDVDPSKVKKQRATTSFYSVMRSMDYATKANLERLRKKSEAEKAALALKDRQKRINELYALVAQLRQKLSSGNYDAGLEAQLSQAKTELFWLLCAM